MKALTWEFLQWQSLAYMTQQDSMVLTLIQLHGPSTMASHLMHVLLCQSHLFRQSGHLLFQGASESDLDFLDKPELD